VNVLGVVQRYHPVIGGSEILAKSFMDYLAKKHNVTIFTTTADDIESFWDKNSRRITQTSSLNYEVRRFDFLLPTEIKYDKRITDFPFATNYPGPFSPKMWNDLVLKKIDYDLIYVTSFPHDHIIPAYIAAKKWNIPIIITPLIHQEFPELYLSVMKLTMLNNSDAIFVISNSEKRILEKEGIDGNKISVIRPFVNFPNNEVIDKTEVKKNYSLSPQAKIVLFVGSKSFVKGIIHLIEAMKLLWETNEELVLVLLGPNTKEYEAYFSKLPKKFRDKIVDAGLVPEEDKRKILFSCDLLAVPSKSESFGLAYMEAWLFSKPVIGCNVPPVTELIDQGKNGLLVEFGNIKKLAESIIYLVNNPKVCEDFGKAGRKKALLYNSENNLKTFEESCLSVVNEFKSKKPQ